MAGICMQGHMYSGYNFETFGYLKPTTEVCDQGRFEQSPYPLRYKTIDRCSGPWKISQHHSTNYTRLHLNNQLTQLIQTFLNFQHSFYVPIFKMRPSTIITVFISVVAASKCKGNRHPSVDELTVSQAQNTCGNDMTVQCCNKVSNTPAGNAAGQGSGVLNGLTLLDGCSDLDRKSVV